MTTNDRLPLLDNPPRKSNGSIDHTGCPHDATPAGRKLCRDHVAQRNLTAWPRGKTFGELTPPQRMAATKRAARQLERELTANADAIGTIVDDGAAERVRTTSKSSGGTTDTGRVRPRRPRPTEVVGRWVTIDRTDAVEGDWVRVTADPSTGRTVWVGELVGWSTRYLSILNPPPHLAFTRHLRVDRGEVLSVERFESDAPEWLIMCAKRAEKRNVR